MCRPDISDGKIQGPPPVTHAMITRAPQQLHVIYHVTCYISDNSQYYLDVRYLLSPIIDRCLQLVISMHHLYVHAPPHLFKQQQCWHAQAQVSSTHAL